MADANPTADTTAVNQPQQSPINISDWVKKFKNSEKIMRSEFQPKYRLAKRRMRSEYEVKGRGSKKMTHDNVSLVYSIGQSFVSSVYFKAPNCNLTAREEVDHVLIENTEIKVNDWIKDNKVKKAIKRIIWDAYLGGFGARFIDKEYQDIEDPNNYAIPPQIDPLTGQVISEGKHSRIVLKDEITITRIRPDLVRFPKGFDFDNYQDSPWIGFVVITPIEEVKNHENWDKNVAEKIEGEKYTSLSDSENKNTQDDQGDDLYAAIEYVLIKPQTSLEPFKLLVFCAKYTEAPLQMIDFDKGTVGYPLKFLYFNPLDDDCSYPNGDPWNFESQLNAVDTWWRKMRRHVDKSNPKRIYDSGSISKDEVMNLKTNNDLEWVGVENKQRRPVGDLVKTLEAAQVHPDVTNFYQVARELISELAPRSGMARGAEDQKVDTATEAKIINTGEIIDIEARIDVIRDFIEDIVLDVAGILAKSQDQPIPLAIPIKDAQGNVIETSHQMVEKSGFTSKINVDVDVESMQAQNKDVFRRQMLQLLEFLVKFEPVMNKPKLDPETGQIVPGKTINPLFWLERIMETYNIRNVEKGVMDLPPLPAPIDSGSVPGSVPPDGMMPEEGMAMEDAMAGRV